MTYVRGRFGICPTGHGFGHGLVKMGQTAWRLGLPRFPSSLAVQHIQDHRGRAVQPQDPVPINYGNAGCPAMVRHVVGQFTSC